jgi:predicted hydrolase (HD superfamily)
MLGYARQFGEDELLWGCTGLLHDFDYERHPDAPAHPTVGIAHLRALGWPEEMLDAIAGHAPYLGVPRNTLLAKTLFAVDELCGFILAVAYVRPSRSLADLEASSVRKKMKDKAFAKAVSREDLVLGAAELGVEMDQHIANCIHYLRPVAARLGLSEG